jgi:hypothetical protein
LDKVKEQWNSHYCCWCSRHLVLLT